MELNDRIALLDSLLVLNEQAGLPEEQVIKLVEFLGGLKAVERESILDHINQEAENNRFGRFVKLANMETGLRNKVLKAMGLQTADSNGFLKEFLGTAVEGTNHVKQTINDLTDIRIKIQEGFFEPLAKLFERDKPSKK